MKDEKKDGEKGGFSLPSFGKLTVGPSGKFDQGSAYDAMNSESTGKGANGSGTYGQGGKGSESKVYDGPGSDGAEQY